MFIRPVALLLAALAIAGQAQNSLPQDIHPVTLSRLPPVTPDDLDEEGKRLLPRGRTSPRDQDRRTSRSIAPGIATWASHQARVALSALDTFSSRFSLLQERLTNSTNGRDTSRRRCGKAWSNRLSMS